MPSSPTTHCIICSSHLFLFSAYSSHPGVAWPSRRTIWYAVVLNWTEVSAWKGALYWICRSSYTTTSCFRPTPHRQPCVPRMKKVQTEQFSPPRGWAQDLIHPLPNAPPWFTRTNLGMALFWINNNKKKFPLMMDWGDLEAHSLLDVRKTNVSAPCRWGRTIPAGFKCLHLSVWNNHTSGICLIT